jgi:mannose-6-phosphate isomerase
VTAPPTPAYPMLLEPRYVEKPWGGRMLETAFGRALPAGVRVGESWELFDRPGTSSVVRNGPLAGRTVASMRGRREVPILFKILDMRERISLQVHPDEEAARADDAADPKTEAWVVLAAAPGARVWRGLREGVTADAFREAVAAGDAYDCLRSFEPKAGDVILIPAGTVHSAGGGLLVAEVQQNSETTYRLHDAGREGRAIHRDQGLRALRFANPGDDTVAPTEEEEDDNHRRLRLVSTRWFTVEHLLGAGAFTLTTEREERDRWHAIFFLRGRGVVRAFARGAPEAPFGPGDTVFLPAAHDHYEVEAADGRPVEAISFHEGA